MMEPIGDDNADKRHQTARLSTIKVKHVLVISVIAVLIPLILQPYVCPEIYIEKIYGENVLLCRSVVPTFFNQTDALMINTQYAFGVEYIVMLVKEPDFGVMIKFSTEYGDIFVAGLQGSELAFIYHRPAIFVSKVNTPIPLQTSFEFPDVKCLYRLKLRGPDGEVVYPDTIDPYTDTVLDLPASLSKVRNSKKSECYMDKLYANTIFTYIPVDTDVSVTSYLNITRTHETGPMWRMYSISAALPKGDKAQVEPKMLPALINAKPMGYSVDIRTIVDFGLAVK